MSERIWLHYNTLAAILSLIQWRGYVVSGDSKRLAEVGLIAWACDIIFGTMLVAMRRGFSSGVVEEETEGSRNFRSKIGCKKSRSKSAPSR
jgi:hypothetical protein